jgi:hypothetical protein
VLQLGRECVDVRIELHLLLFGETLHVSALIMEVAHRRLKCLCVGLVPLLGLIENVDLFLLLIILQLHLIEPIHRIREVSPNLVVLLNQDLYLLMLL